MSSSRPTDEDFLVAIESALEAQLLPEPGLEVLQRARDAVLDAVGPLVVQLRQASPVPSAPADRAALRDRIAEVIHDDLTNHKVRRDQGLLGIVPRLTDAVLAVLPEPADRAAEVAKHVTRAIHALKSPAPSGSEHYRSGWDDGLEAAIDAARDAVLRRVADEATAEHHTVDGVRHLCHTGDHYCPDADGPSRMADEAQQPETPLRAELKPWQLLGDVPDEPLPQTERLVGGRRLTRDGARQADTAGEQQ